MSTDNSYRYSGGVSETLTPRGLPAVPAPSTRPGPFGLTIQIREVRTCKVRRFRHETGQYVHAVDDALVEWVSGSPVLVIRYLLACGDVRDQTRGHVLHPDTPVTCRKCRAVAEKAKQKQEVERCGP